MYLPVVSYTDFVKEECPSLASYERSGEPGFGGGATGQRSGGEWGGGCAEGGA